MSSIPGAPGSVPAPVVLFGTEPVVVGTAAVPLVEDGTPLMGLVDCVVEVKKVVGVVVVVSAGDRPELNEDDVDESGSLVVDDSSQLVEELPGVGTGKNDVEEAVVPGRVDEAKVVLEKGGNVLEFCEGNSVAVLDKSFVVSPGGDVDVKAVSVGFRLVDEELDEYVKDAIDELIESESSEDAELGVVADVMVGSKVPVTLLEGPAVNVGAVLDRLLDIVEVRDSGVLVKLPDALGVKDGA